MSAGRDDWERAREEREEREAAQGVIETAAAVRREMGEQEWQRVGLICRAGSWIGTAGVLAVLLSLVALLLSVGTPYLSRVAPMLMRDRTPPFGGDVTLLCVGLGVGVLLLVAGWVAMQVAEGRLRAVAGSDERAAMAFSCLAGGAEMWERMAGEGRQTAAGEGAAATRDATTEVATGSHLAAEPRDRWDRRHWLLVEVSGAHLIWWLSVVAVTVYTRSPVWMSSDRIPSPDEIEAMLEAAPPDWLVDGLFAIAGVGFVLKVIITGALLGAWVRCGRNPETRGQIRRYYRFWAKGLLPATLALLPGLVPWAVVRLLP